MNQQNKKRLTGLVVGGAVAALLALPGVATSPAEGALAQTALTAEPTLLVPLTAVVEAGPEVDRAGPSSFFPVDTECLKFQANGVQEFWGEEAVGLDPMGVALSEIVEQYSQDAVGVAYCSDRQGAAIFVADLTDSLADEIAGVAANYPDLTIVIEDAAAGLDGVEEAMFALRDSELASLLPTIGLDTYTGGLAISALPSDSTDDASAAAITAEVIHTRVLELTGLDLPIALRHDGSVWEDASGTSTLPINSIQLG
jgi:hypothetical protein